MSIATQLTKLETDISDAYDAVDAKNGTIPQNKNSENLKIAISSIPTGGGSIGSVTDEDTDITLNNTINAKFDVFTIKGNTIQNGTPAPDNQAIIKNVGSDGSIVIQISNSDSSQSQTINFPLESGQILHTGDYLDDDGIHITKGTKILDGTENWQGSITHRFYTAVSGIKSNVNTGICDLFETKALEKTNGVTFGYSSNYVYFYYDDISGITNWKNWLASHNVTIEYELENELVVPYTSAQLQAYLNLLKLKSYNGTTNITTTVSTNEAKAIINATALTLS